MKPDQWIVLIARSEREIAWDPGLTYDPPAYDVKEPSEIVTKRICMIGEEHAFENILEFLDGPSRAEFEANRILLPDTQAYFDREFIMNLKHKRFDNVIINLDDEVAFRLTLFILAQFGKDDPFLARIVTVINNPVTEDLLNRNIKYKNTILGEKLAAKYATQITYQKSLEPIMDDLMSPEGYEFNLLEIGPDYPREWLTSKHEVKQVLLRNRIVYVGIVDTDNMVRFDADDFSHAWKLVVLAKGIV